jgi:hypothetical protein
VTTGERVSLLEHLAELDGLLRDIQSELMPDLEPAPVLGNATHDPPATHEPPPTPAPESQPRAPQPATHGDPQREVLTARLLASTRELLAGYERVLVPSPAPGPPPSRRSAPRRPESPDVTLAAGPFASLEALREFEQAVSHLPGVRDVAVRGYEGTDRAIIEVRLDQSNP